MRIRQSCVLILLFLTSPLFATEVTMELAKAPVNIHDSASIKRGAKYFSTICIACHTLIYLRYDPIAVAAGITYERMPLHVKQWPFNEKPPDLSLETDVRGADWIYTYIQSFYIDKFARTGFNNLVYPNTAMPDMFASFQGTQILAPDIKMATGVYQHTFQWYDLVELQKQGSMTGDQFDQMAMDIVNFLSYAAEPYAVTQRRLGFWVIGFLCILFILTFSLKKAYWQDVRKKEQSHF